VTFRPMTPIKEGCLLRSTRDHKLVRESIGVPNGIGDLVLPVRTGVSSGLIRGDRLSLLAVQHEFVYSAR
jgi:hypothetical protein